MSICKPGDTIIVPPATIGGHVTHHSPGCAGLFGLNIIEAPIDKDYYTVDIDQLRELALKEKPKTTYEKASPDGDVRKIEGLTPEELEEYNRLCSNEKPEI